MSDCVFCKIISGQLPSRRIYEDDHAVAFLDLAPWQPGHALVVPRTHVESVLTGPATMAEIGPAIDHCARLLVEVLEADGLNLISSAGAVAGQEVFHLHVHLVPRFARSPGLPGLFGRAPAAPEDLDRVHAMITAQL